MARWLGVRRVMRAPRFRPAWFDATYLAAPAPPIPSGPRAYDELERAAIWQKGRPMPGWDPEDWRIDHRGNPIFRHHYADDQSAFGWEIELIRPDEGDSLANVRPQLCPVVELAAARKESAFDFDRFTP
jgi:hypothetical protein